MKAPLDAGFWVQRAADARKSAQGMRNPMAKKAMERLAATYEAYARSAAERDAEVAPEAADSSRPGWAAHGRKGAPLPARAPQQ